MACKIFGHTHGNKHFCSRACSPCMAILPMTLRFMPLEETEFSPHTRWDIPTRETIDTTPVFSQRVPRYQLRYSFSIFQVGVSLIVEHMNKFHMKTLAVRHQNWINLQPCPSNVTQIVRH
jgi:hypothetical protein